MIELDDRLEGLSSVLFPPETPVGTLPVDGYVPPKGGAWQPRQAAVLVPILSGPEPSVLLTVRSDAMSSHAGQVALPGGGRHQQEPFPVGTALREAAEETGVDVNAVQVLGLLKRFDTISAYRVVPVVGILPRPDRLTPCPKEVRAVFEVPLQQVLDPALYRQHRVRYRDRGYSVWSMKSGRWPIWGATASILGHLAALVAEQAA